MTIETIRDGGKTSLIIEGRLDTTTAPGLEAEVQKVLPDTSELVFDFTKLEYISSAGLRVLLSSQKAINKASGTMCVTNPNEEVMSVFEVTGFSDILTIK